MSYQDVVPRSAYPIQGQVEQPQVSQGVNEAVAAEVSRQENVSVFVNDGQPGETENLKAPYTTCLLYTSPSPRD